jgi:hypothetical protein
VKYAGWRVEPNMLLLLGFLSNDAATCSYGRADFVFIKPGRKSCQ